MFVNAIKNAKSAIFPIVVRKVENFQKSGKSQPKVGVAICGTGFFISEDGLFLTADHVIESIYKMKGHAIFCGVSQEKLLPKAQRISILFRDKTRDIALGKVENFQSSSLSLLDNNPLVGKSICTGGFAVPRIQSSIKNGGYSLNFKTAPKHWHPSTVIGFEKKMNLSHGKKFDALILHEHGIKGLSGGPILTPEGFVAGIFSSAISRGALPPNSNLAHLYVVNNSAAVAINEINDFLKTYYERRKTA